MLMMMPPGRMAPVGQLAQLGDAVQGLLDRHLLQRGDEVHHGLRRPDHLGHGVRVRLIGPTLARPETSVVTLRNRPIRPVGGASMTTAS